MQEADKHLKQIKINITKDIEKEEECLKNKTSPEIIKFGHRRVLKMLKKYKKKIEEMV